jgi:hypothetical protein
LDFTENYAQVFLYFKIKFVTTNSDYEATLIFNDPDDDFSVKKITIVFLENWEDKEHISIGKINIFKKSSEEKDESKFGNPNTTTTTTITETIDTNNNDNYAERYGF